jgi:DNA-binding transcriptional ArsR family regulator
MLSEASLRDLRAFHRALGDVTRLRIVQLLATEGEQPVSEIARRLHVSQPLLTWHLHRLKRPGIVRTVRVGREVRCSFDRARYAELTERSARTLMNPASAAEAYMRSSLAAERRW